METAYSNSLCFLCVNSFYNWASAGGYQNPGIIVWHLFSGNTSTRILSVGGAISGCKLQVNNTLAVALVYSSDLASSNLAGTYNPGLFIHHILYDTTPTNSGFSTYKFYK